MISPEVLRRFPFFGSLSAAQLQAVAELTEEASFDKGSLIFMENQPADIYCLLVSGSIDLSYSSEEEFHPKTRKEFSVGEVNPGEPFGFSALLEPYVYNATAKAAQDCEVLKIDAIQLRNLFSDDSALTLIIMTQTAQALMERLKSVRVQLAAAWA